MADNIINQSINKFSKNLDQGLASLYNRDQVVGLENRYGNQYGIQNSASGPLSDARHMSAMNNLSNSLSPMNNSIGNFIGDVGAFGAGLVNEVPAALTRGFNKENYGEIMEDIAANARGTFGTPNTTTAQQIFDSVFSNSIPTQTTSNIGNYGTAQAAEINPNNTFTSSVANSPYEMDYMPPNRYTDFAPRVGTPQTTEEVSMFDRVKDFASSGLAKTGKIGMDAFNMLKNNNPIGLLTSGLASLGNMFEDKTLYGDTIDEYGNRYTADQLNSMNARGGGYTDAARSSRRRTARISKMQQRREDGYNFSLKNLEKLQRQEALQKAANEQRAATLAAQAAAGTHTRGGTAIDFGDYYNSDGSANTSSSMANNPSQSYGGPRAKGGFIGYKNGGLVKMFKGKL